MKHTKSIVYQPSAEAHELFLYAINDGELYRNMICPVIENMKKKIKKGVYNAEKAQDAFYYVATQASKDYFRDFGYSFNVTNRYTVAVEMVEYYQDEMFFDA